MWNPGGWSGIPVHQDMSGSRILPRRSSSTFGVWKGCCLQYAAIKRKEGTSSCLSQAGGSGSLRLHSATTPFPASINNGCEHPLVSLYFCCVVVER